MGGEYDYISRGDRADNMLNATRDVLAETPHKVWEQLAQDAHDPQKVMTVGAVSAGVGYGATALLSKFPKVGGVVAAGVLAYQGIKYAGDTIDFLQEAGDTSNELQRRLLVERASNGLARESATLIESTPGMLAGGALAVRVHGMPPAYSAVGRFTDRNLIQPVKGASTATKEFVAEQWAFNGPGRMRLSSNILQQDGRVNALELGDMLAAKHPWTGVETGRSISLTRQKISRPVTGESNTINFGFRDRPGNIPFHTHAPDNPIGTRPGRFDLLATQDLGIVQRGSQTAYYVGQGREFNAAVASGTTESFAPRLQTLVMDHQRQSAFLMDATWQPKLSRWDGALPKYVDYKGAQEALRRLDVTRAWQQFEQIPTLPSLRGQNVDFDALTWLRTGLVE